MPRLATVIRQVRSRLGLASDSPHQLAIVPQIFWASLRSVILSSAVVTGLCLAVQRVGGFETLELIAFDQWVRLRPSAAMDNRLVIVGITEADIRRFGFPITDEVLAAALERLQTAQVSVIGLDLYRDITVLPGQAALIEQLAAPNVVAINNFAGDIPAPPSVGPERVGFNDFTLDKDGILRRNLLQVGDSDSPYVSLALRVTQRALAQQGIAYDHSSTAIFLNQAVLPRLQSHDGGYQTSDTRGYQILMDYRTPEAIAPLISLSELLDPQTKLDRFQQRIALLGSVAPSLKDFLPTPYSAVRQQSFQMSGVMVHAQMISHLLDLAEGKRPSFRFWPQWLEILWLGTWAVGGSLVAWRLKRPITIAIFAAGGLTIIIGISAALYFHLVWVPAVAPAVAFLGTLGLAMTHRLFYTTTHDAVTGALNEASLLAYLRRSLKRRQRRHQAVPLGLFYIHLSQLGLVNSSLGQTTGNYVWQALMARLQARLPRSAKIARIDEDDCAIAVPDRDKPALERLAHDLQVDITKPIDLPEQQSVVTETNIGIAITQPDYRYTAENLLRDAHTAMYKSRSLGQVQYQVFASGMLEVNVARFALEGELRRGIAEEEFEVYYQPIVSLKTGKVAGFESLVRWQHPQRGLIGPGTFMSLAEETGLIIALGQWICETACKQAHQWKCQFSQWPMLISINLSSRQFEQPDLVEQLAQSFQHRQREGLIFKLEVTESMVMGDVEAAIDLMLKLRSLGCKLSLDDFGTGYSSLSYLRRFPIDTLKVDQSFVRNMDSSEDLAIVRTIIDLAHTLGMDVIAEGVETAADAEALRSLNCEYGQGYYWAKPLTAAAATTLLAENFDGDPST
ncbi:MAG: putative bifunctional diguanylate cyclase/phosphodiesterase [Leptolyngbyaceae cyanobacterium]